MLSPFWKTHKNTSFEKRVVLKKACHFLYLYFVAILPGTEMDLPEVWVLTSSVLFGNNGTFQVQFYGLFSSLMKAGGGYHGHVVWQDTYD